MLLQFVVVSRFPPPVGGVTVFAQRKVAELKRQGETVQIIDFNSRVWVLKLIFFALSQKQARYLVNTLSPIVLSFIWGLGLLNKCSVYDHNASRHYFGSVMKKRILLFFSRRAGQMVVVHERLQKLYEANGVVAQIESPFLPPDTTRKAELFARYPNSLLEFISSHQHRIMLNSAWRYVESTHQNDLYGLRSTLELLRRLTEMRIPVRLVFAFGEYNRDDVPQGIQEEIEALERAGVLYLMDGQLELWPLFQHIDLFLRTTATDGESVSVLESVFFNCPVVASDVVPRPEGVMTYQYGNICHLTEVVSKSLASISHQSH